MITLSDINKAINLNIINAIKDTEFGNVEIAAEDVTEPIIRPSIKIQIEDFKSGKFNSCNKERTLTVRVYFFAKDKNKYKLDNFKMQGILENAFLDDLQISDTFYIPIEEVESEVSDTVLIASFELYSVEVIEEEPGEPIENLEYNLTLN